MRILLDLYNFSIFSSLSAIGRLLVRPHGKYAFVFDRNYMSNNQNRPDLMEKSLFIPGVSSVNCEIKSPLLFRNLI